MPAVWRSIPSWVSDPGHHAEFAYQQVVPAVRYRIQELCFRFFSVQILRNANGLFSLLVMVIASEAMHSEPGRLDCRVERIPWRGVDGTPASNHSIGERYFKLRAGYVSPPCHESGLVITGVP